MLQIENRTVHLKCKVGRQAQQALRVVQQLVAVRLMQSRSPGATRRVGPMVPVAA